MLAVLKVKKTISGTMELGLPPIIVISVAAAAAILKDIDVEAPTPSRQGQESRERQEQTPTYLTGWWKLITCSAFCDLVSRGARVVRCCSRVSSERFLWLIKETISRRRQKIELFWPVGTDALLVRDQLKTTISNSLAWSMGYDMARG